MSEEGKKRKNKIHTAVLLSVLILGVLIANFTGLDWGLPNHYSWAPDALHPYSVFRAMDQRFSGGWFDKYPPLQYMLNGLVYLPASRLLDAEEKAAIQEGIKTFFENPSLSKRLVEPRMDREALSLLITLGRCMNALMGVITVLALFLAGRELFGTGAGWMAALVAGSHPILIFYAHTMNTEAPYFMWSALGLYCYFRVLRRHDRWGYAGLGVFAALATATKEQAFGLFALLPFVLVYSRARNRVGARPSLKQIVRVVWDGKILLGAGVFVAATLLANNLVFNFGGYLDHLAFNAPGVSVLERMYPFTFGGCAELTWDTLVWIYRTATLPAVVLGLLGMVLVWRQEKGMVPLMILPAFSYFVIFILYIGFLTPRYVTPMFFPLALFAGRALIGLWKWRSIPSVPRRLAACALVVYFALLGGGISLCFKDDPRYEAETWMEDHLPSGAKILSFGSPMYSLCRLPENSAPYPVLRLEDLGKMKSIVKGAKPDCLIITLFHSNLFGTDPLIWIKPFQDKFKRMGYEIVKTVNPKWDHPALRYLFLNPWIVLVMKTRP
jgi:4-amino-4-deoxy-L-arabinose transferase-like glycosyltransferase